MKKKTLAAASLLLALLMPLGATPLAVYAEGDGEAQTGISTVGEAPENGNSIAPTVPDDKAIVASNNQQYDSLDEAMDAAANGDTIYLGAGVYCGNAANSTQAGKGAGKSLTFVGAGTDKTTWQIKAPATKYGGDGWCDYSFKNSDSITFESMTVIGSVYTDNTIQSKDTQGLTYINNITLKNCIFNGRADYWGYQTTTFENVIFNAPGTAASGIDTTDYSLWTLTGKSYTFKNCTFNATGKIINVYTYYSVDKNDVTVNFDSCTVNSTKANKTALSINDSLMTDSGCNHKFYVNIIGNNTIKGLKPDTKTCSRLFGFSNDKIYLYNGKELHYDSGATVVTINGIPVWEKAARIVEHNGNNFDEGTYDNGTGSGSDNRYTDGYKDGQVYKVYGDWSGWTEDANVPHLFHRTRTVNEKCHYCSYDEPLDDETETENAYLLHYDLNGGTGAESADYSDHYYFKPKDGNTATVAADPSRAGYQFAGWQDAAGNQYAAGNTVTVDHDITLTAQWNKLVTVSFDLCGHGGANIPSQTFVSGNKASEPTAPKEDGWVFGGWYTEKGCQYRFSFDSAVTSDITLYAKWDRVTTVVSAPVATPTPTPTPTPSPAPAAAATKTATVKNAAIPQTSDAFPMEGLLALLAVGAVGFGAAGWLRKKHH